MVVVKNILQQQSTITSREMAHLKSKTNREKFRSKLTFGVQSKRVGKMPAKLAIVGRCNGLSFRGGASLRILGSVSQHALHKAAG